MVEAQIHGLPPQLRELLRRHVALDRQVVGQGAEVLADGQDSAAGFAQVSVEFTHQVADGIHGAIVRAVKTREPETKGLPVVQPASSAGCC